MTILLRVLLNNTNTQMSQSDSISYSLNYTQQRLFYVYSMNVLLDNSLKMINQIMHFIYFFKDNKYSLMNTLVHGKEIVNIYE